MVIEKITNTWKEKNIPLLISLIYKIDDNKQIPEKVLQGIQQSQRVKDILREYISSAGMLIEKGEYENEFLDDLIKAESIIWGEDFEYKLKH